MVRQSGKGRRLVLVLAGVAIAVAAAAAWLSWPRLRFQHFFESLGVNEQGVPAYRHKQTGIVFVRVDPDGGALGVQGPFLVARSALEVDALPEGFPAEKDPVLQGAETLVDRCKNLCRRTGLRPLAVDQWAYVAQAEPGRWGLVFDHSSELCWNTESAEWESVSLAGWAPGFFSDSDVGFRPCYFPLP